jgi:Protein of unknown function (DUF1579)
LKDNYGKPPQLGAKHKKLSAFTGNWHAEGQSYGGPKQNPQDPRANAAPWISDETTEWHPGGFFLIQRENARIGKDALVTHSIVGYDEKTGHYFAHAIENHGFYRKYDVTCAGRVWTFNSGTERARVTFSRDGKTQTVTWEWRPKGNKWLPLCDRINRRVS